MTQMYQLPDSVLLKKEATVYHDLGQLFAELAQNLLSLGAEFDSKANDIERKSEFLKSLEDKRRLAPREAFSPRVHEATSEERHETEDRITGVAMKAAKALKHAHIIKKEVQSLFGSAVEENEIKVNDKRTSSGDVLSELSPTDISTLVCALAAEILVKPELMDISGQTQNVEIFEGSEDTSSTGSILKRDLSPVESIPLELKERHPYMPNCGFVTDSGWIAINMRQHW